MSRPPVQLRDDTLADVAGLGIPVPSYDRSRLRPHVVHVGVGGFHRSHLALYTDELARAGSTWGIRGVGLLPNDSATAAALAEQDNLYTLVERSDDTWQPRVVGSIIDYVFLAHASPAERAAVFADPLCRIVSLTITEAGYGAEGVGTFDDLARGLDLRRTAGSEPVTVLSCDNVIGNGETARAATLAACARVSPTLVEWVTERCTFPNSMVDRITPSTTDADRTQLRDELGIEDRAPVMCEPFRQWVLQDHFANGRPDWQDVGATFSEAVEAWELYKLRMLNAAHTSMAYVSALMGFAHVDEALADADVHTFVRRFIFDEAAPVVPPITGHPPGEYATAVLQRFANRGVRDQIARICVDGTAKMPPFVVPTVERQLDARGPISCAALAMAAWRQYLLQFGSSVATDRLLETTLPYLGPDPARFLEHRAVFGERLPAEPRFRDAFTAACNALRDVDPRSALQRTIG